MFRKKALQVTPQIGYFVEPEKAGEMLLKASKINNVGFQWVLVDKPVDGTVFLFSLPKTEPKLPDDGYGWLDDETVERIKLSNGKDLEIISRNQGFGLNDQVVTMQRKRFRFLDDANDLQLIHYLKYPDTLQRIDVRTADIKSPPRNPANMSSAGLTSVSGSPTYPSKAAQARKRPKPKPATTSRIAEDDRDPQGDDLDRNFGRVISLERYKRNHLWMDEIFSPFHTNHLTMPKLFADSGPEAIASLVVQKDRLESEIQVAHSAFVQLAEQTKTRAHSDWKIIDDIKHTKSIKELEFILEKRQSHMISSCE